MSPGTAKASPFVLGAPPSSSIQPAARRHCAALAGNSGCADLSSYSMAGLIRWMGATRASPLPHMHGAMQHAIVTKCRCMRPL